MSRFTGDFLRVLSISAVIVIHSTFIQEVEFQKNHDYFSSAFIGVFFNQLSRFCVPLFILLSGYGLAKKYGDTKKDAVDFSFAAEFYKKRFLKIGIPFLFWTVVLLYFFKKFAFYETYTDSFFMNLPVLFEHLFIRGADYHFYFFTIILECYLLFPLLLKYRSPVLHALLFILLLIFMYPVTVEKYTGLPVTGFPSSFFPHWVFYFYTGMISADDRLIGKIKKPHAAVHALFPLMIFAYVFYGYISRSQNEADPGYYNHFNRFSVLLYSLSFWIFFMKMDPYVESFFQKMKSAKFIPYLAGLSFGVYIYHTMILRFLNLTFLEGTLFIVPPAVIGAFLFTALLDRLIQIKNLRIPAGLP